MTATRTNTKILATLGPASRDKGTIRSLVDNGANVFRLNMSHGDQKTIKETYECVREVEAEIGRPIGILADLQGPKIRCGVFEAGAHELAVGKTFTFDSDPTPGNVNRVHLPHP